MSLWLVAIAAYVLGAALLYAVSLAYHRLIVRVGRPRLHRMRDGSDVYAVAGDLGLQMVFHEIYELEVYDRSDVSLAGVPRPVIVDCGANVGLFSRYMLLKYPGARVFAAEPIPELAAICELNTAFARDRCVVSAVGLGKSASTATFEYIPNLSCGSGIASHLAVATKQVESLDPIGILRAVLVDSVSSGSLPPCWTTPVQAFCFLLTLPYFRVLTAVASVPVFIPILSFLSGANVPKRSVECEIVTLDEMLQRQQLPGDLDIDLVKVDVEGAEIDLLEGMSDALWKRVARIVVETQNLNDNVERVRRLLTSKGFLRVVCVAEELEVHKLIHVTSFFASRIAT
jgi:31-O-methyltransferase